jgi:DNA-directed RNA polymerase subunit RPC12/RpoP
MRTVRKCGQCGAKLRRVHRTFWERFRYLAIYECRHCEREVLIPRHQTYHLGGTCRCPRCGTFRVVKLKVPDKIDPMQGGLLNMMERMAGGNLYHCCFCRVQFFDRRPLDPNASRVANRPGEAQPDSEDSGDTDSEDTDSGEVHPVAVQDDVRIPRDTAKSDA